MNLKLWINSIIFYLTVVFSSNAQNLQGIILDKSNKKPISGAIINLLSKNDSLVLSFGFSNQNGFFKLKKPVALCFGKVTHIGFEELFFDCNNLKQNIDSLIFELQIKENQLSEVYISAKRPLVVNGDTTLYRTESFKTGDEKNLEGLLKKIPNFLIDQDGKIFYKNKLVENIMIDGDNLSGSNYEITTKTLSSDLISEVEAIENFEQNKILRTVRKGDQTVLNLKTKKINSWGGLLVLNKGIKNHDLSSGIIGVNKKIKSLFNGSFNNVGHKRFNPDSKFLPWGSIHNWVKNHAIATVLQPNHYFYNNLSLQQENQNNEGLANFSNNLIINKRLKLNTQVIYSGNKLMSQKSNISNVLLAQNELRFKQTDSSNKSLKVLRLSIGLDYDINANSLLTIKYFMDKSSNHLMSNNLFSAINQTSEIAQPINLDNLHNIGLMEHTFKVNTKNVIKSSLKYFNKYDKSEINIYQENLENNQINDSRQWFGEFETSWTNINKFVEIKTDVFYAKKNFNLNQHNQQFSNQALIFSKENQSINFNTLGIKQFNTFRKKNVKIVSETGLSFINSSSSLNTNLPMFKIGLKSSYSFNSKNNLSTDVAYNENPNWNSNLLISNMLIDFRTSQTGSQKLSLNKELHYSLNYNYLDFLKSKSNLNLTLFGIKYFQSIGFFNIDFSDFNQSLSLYNASNNYSVGVLGKLDQLIYKLRGNLRLEMSYIVSGSENVFNGKPSFNKFSNAKGKINFQSKLSDVFFYEIGDEIEYYKNFFDVYDTNKKSSFWMNNVLLKSGINIKKMNFSLSMRNFTTQNNSFSFLNSNLTFQLNQAFNLNFDAYNLTNVQSYQLTRFSAIQRSDTHFGILGRSLLIGLNINF